MPTRRCFSRRSFCNAWLLALAAGAVQADEPYPTRPIRIIVPFSAGGGIDVLGRTIGQKLSEAWQYAAVVENRPGASGNIGTNAIAKAQPDGYTFGVSITGPLVNNTVLFDSLPYDPAKDIAPLTLAVHQPNVLVVPTASGIANVAQLLDTLKKNPDKYNFPSTGAGTVSHLSVELMLQQIGAKAVHAPYPSSPAALTSLLSGDTQFAALPPIAVMPMVKDGRLKALAVNTRERLPGLPGVPTFAEQGYQGLEDTVWLGIVAQAGVPADIVQRLNREIAKAVRAEDMKKLYDAHGSVVYTSSPEEFAARIKADHALWGPVIRKANISLD